jgi:pimeloyl-ACP methyl ester carboxylesterase
MAINLASQAFRVLGIVAGACVVTLCGAVPARAAEPPTAKELYRQALVVMNDLKEPAFVTFRLEGVSEGMRVDWTTDNCDNVEVSHESFTYGNNRVRWALRHRTEDYRTEVVDSADGRRYVSNVDPTWLTTYRSLRNAPFHFGPLHCPFGPARNQPAPAPSEPPASPGPALQTIGTVVALGPGIYNVEDRGDQACSNGDPGHALHLWSRTNNPRHTLSDVVIDLRSLRFCSVRFAVHDGGVNGGTVVIEEHFADIGGYWLQTDGFLEGTARIAGIKALHGVWRFRLSDFAFPASLPQQAFVPPPAFDPAPYLHAQQMVDIGGRRLNLYCTGSGSPTVVLDANESDDTSDWRFVQPLLAKRTRACSYDRAGFGFSDPGPFPRDAAAYVSDLRALLQKAPIARPFVLVGYSSSTLSARLYAERHLDDLAGLVLVEPDIEDQEKALFAVAPALQPGFEQGFAAAKACTAATERGGLKPHTQLYDVCTSQDPQLPASLKAVVAKRQLRPEWWRAYNSDQTSDRTISTAEVRNEQRQYGNLPLAVVVAADAFPGDWPLPADQRRAEREFMRKFTAPLATYSSIGSRVEVEGCSHGDIATHCASSVAAAIDKVVDQARHPR